MRGVVFLGDRRAEVRDFGDPEPDPGEKVILVGLTAKQTETLAHLERASVFCCRIKGNEATRTARPRPGHRKSRTA